MAADGAAVVVVDGAAVVVVDGDAVAAVDGDAVATSEAAVEAVGFDTAAAPDEHATTSTAAMAGSTNQDRDIGIS
jgi:hypothetical protein